MTNFETRANNIKTAIEVARHRVNDFGYSDDSTAETISRVVGMFVTWLTACEEARQQGSFAGNILANLPQQDDPSWSEYISPPPNSTLLQRAEGLWGIRIAYTHADGDLNLITNQRNKQFAIDSASTFDAVSIQNDRLILTEGLYHQAIRTMVQIRDVLP